MEDINARRLEALEWAITGGHVITQSHNGHFVATADGDTDEPWASQRRLAMLADELGRIKETMERKP